MHMWKRDEMEQSIYDKSARISWQVTLIALVILGFYKNYTVGGSNPFSLIASLSVLLQVFLERLYFSKVTDKKNFFKFIGKVLLLSFIIITLMMWFIR